MTQHMSASDFTAWRKPPTVVSICAASSAALNATWRAALVARELGTKLHILHPAPHARVVSREETMRELVEDIAQRTRLNVTVEAVEGNVLRRAVAASRDAAMVVLPSNRGNPLREWIMGTQAERLIRLCHSPVLVVKRPALLGYRRVLVPLDIEEQAVPLIALAASLSRGSRLEVLHAIDTSDEEILQSISDSQEALRSFRQHRAQRAFLALHRLISSAQAGEAGAEAAIEFGDVPSVVLGRARASDAELMVIGKAQRGLLAAYFLGGLTQRMLAQAPADVLVLPHSGRRVDTVNEEAHPASGEPMRAGQWV